MRRGIKDAKVENYSIYNTEGILYVHPKKNETFIIVEEFCGDCTLWFITKMHNNEEFERINLKYVLSVKYKLKVG